MREDDADVKEINDKQRRGKKANVKKKKEKGEENLFQRGKEIDWTKIISTWRKKKSTKSPCKIIKTNQINYVHKDNFLEEPQE